MELKRNFVQGAMNKDIEERLLPDGYYIDAVNIDVSNSEGSDGGMVRNVKGNTLVGNLDDATNSTVANAKCIGATKDEATNRIYWFVTSDNFDGVYEYDEDTDTIVRVLESTTGQLNFSADYYITGVNFIDGFLYWTDNLNAPRRVNISFVKGFSVDDDRIDEYINVIVGAPLRAPSIEMDNEDNQENHMEDKFLQFAYRYKYRDNQYSALSPFTGVAFVPGSYELDYAAGNNEAMLNTKNKVLVTFETGNKFVEEVQLVVRDTKNLNTYIVENFKKSVLGIENYSTKTFSFKNNKIYSVLPQDQVTRLFDNVPVKAKAQDIIDRRLVYGNYTQFYDILDCDGNEIDIDYSVDYTSEDTASGTAIQTFRTDRDYEIGITYLDDYGRASTVITNPTDDANTVYIPATQSDKGNSLVVSIAHKAPCFATHYRLVVKENKKSYYNIFPILYYPDGVYRWFLINESDKNKFAVGDYVIFKSDGSGPTYSNEKYKILEFGVKPKDFLTSGNEEGVYMKIKVNAGDFPANNLSVYYSCGTGAGAAYNNAENTFKKGGRNPLNTDSGGLNGVNPVFQDLEPPIHYGSGNDALSAIEIGSGIDYDTRIYVEILPLNKYRYRIFEGGNGLSNVNPGWINDGSGVSGTYTITNSDTWLKAIFPGGLSSGYQNLVKIKFTGSGYTPGDYFAINIRDNTFVGGGSGNNLFGTIKTSRLTLNGGCLSISNLNGNNDLQINAGAKVTIEYQEGKFTSSFFPQFSDDIVFSASSRNYKNIEEWYIEEGHWNDPSVSWGKNVIFRRGFSWEELSNGTGCSDTPEVNSMYQGKGVTSQGSVRMMIGIGDPNQYTDNANSCSNVEVTYVRACWTVKQLDNPLLAETEPLEVDTQIFHETARTFPIENRQHKVRWDYEDYLDASTAYPTLTANLANSSPAINIAGKTVIGQATPGAATTASDIPHNYHAGDILYVVSSSTTYGPQAPPLSTGYEVLYVIDQYNVVIDLAFPGSGPVTAGTASLFSVNEPTIETNQNSPTQPAVIKINHPQNPNGTYNGYAFGNGLESDRIRDDFNETELQFSPRASLVIEDYEQEEKEASLCYSGIYKGDTSINRLNEFNLSKANFKNLDREFGSIQKLFARDTDLLVLQEDKTSKVLYGKNLLSDAVGGGQISSVPEVLGTQVAYSGEYGISFNPESFAEWGNMLFWTDERRNAVLQMTAGQIYDISQYGMKDYFRDMYRDNPRTQKIGVYDPYRHHYIIASNEESSTPCYLELSKDGDNYPATNPGLEEINDIRPDFFVFSNTSWTVSIVYSAGWNWVAGYPASGFGNQAIYLGIADNNTNANRTATITFTYCDGLTATYIVTQARGKKVTVRPIVAHNGRIKKF